MIFLDGPARHRGRPAQPRPEAVARDRHAADAGPRAADARRADRRHERRASASKTAELLKRIMQEPLGDRDRARHGVRQAASPHKVTVLHQGKILAEGPMEKVQADPKVIEVYLGH